MPLDSVAIARLTARPVPRYTSYPTAPHFHAGVDGATYRAWLAALPKGARLSLYLHLPFCDSLCWFCGCTTKVTRQYAPIAAYLKALKAEIDLVAAALPEGVSVSHLHWGGGSPTILNPEDIAGLTAHLRGRFAFSEGAEFAVEIDPRGTDGARIAALAAAGMTRASLGVQDFTPEVQQAINRVQSFEETQSVVEACRAAGISSLNIDALYGLPGQGAAELQATLEKVVALKPDRVAVFGYAHVPWMKRHQEMIDARALPGAAARYDHAELAARLLTGVGYQRIGLDHFALPGDAMAVAAREGRLQRNFQGYTVDPATALLGLGASAIGALPQGYVQNDPATGRYMRAVAGGALPVVKGFALAEEDRMRRAVIERIMCDLRFDGAELVARWGRALAAPVLAEAEALLASDEDGFLYRRGAGFAVTETGRPFLRLIAAAFDRYLPKREGGHSLSV